MPTAVAGYRLADGTKVPSVTTVLGKFKDPGGLKYWAYERGRAGKELYTKDADIGTLAHAMVEARVKQQAMPMRPDQMAAGDFAKAEAAFNAYLTWERHSKLSILSTEMSYVSEQHRYGGTIDALAEIDGDPVLPDWKTSNRIYPDMLAQVAAYGQLWEENNPGQRIRGFHICRFSKEFGDFDHKYFGELGEAFEMFLLLRRAYDIQARLEKRAA